MPTPKSTRRLLRRLLNEGFLTFPQFKKIHHLGKDPISHYKYLMRIDSYQGEDSRNLQVHVELKRLAAQFGA